MIATIIFVLFLIVGSIFYKRLFTHLYCGFDVYCYYGKYEQRISKGIQVSWFWRVMFWEVIIRSGDRPIVPIYRVVHFLFGLILFALPALALYFWLSWVLALIYVIEFVIGYLWAFYRMHFEFEYYTISETQLKDGEDVYWLKHWFYIGSELFRYAFRWAEFQKQSRIGQVGFALTSILYLIYFII